MRQPGEPVGHNKEADGKRYCSGCRYPPCKGPREGCENTRTQRGKIRFMEWVCRVCKAQGSTLDYPQGLASTETNAGVQETAEQCEPELHAFDAIAALGSPQNTDMSMATPRASEENDAATRLDNNTEVNKAAVAGYCELPGSGNCKTQHVSSTPRKCPLCKGNEPDIRFRHMSIVCYTCEFPNCATCGRQRQESEGARYKGNTNKY